MSTGTYAAVPSEDAHGPHSHVVFVPEARAAPKHTKPGDAEYIGCRGLEPMWEAVAIVDMLAWIYRFVVWVYAIEEVSGVRMLSVASTLAMYWFLFALEFLVLLFKLFCLWFGAPYTSLVKDAQGRSTAVYKAEHHHPRVGASWFAFMVAIITVTRISIFRRSLTTAELTAFDVYGSDYVWDSAISIERRWTDIMNMAVVLGIFTLFVTVGTCCWRMMYPVYAQEAYKEPSKIVCHTGTRCMVIDGKVVCQT